MGSPYLELLHTVPSQTRASPEFNSTPPVSSIDYF